MVCLDSRIVPCGTALYVAVVSVLWFGCGVQLLQDCLAVCAWGMQTQLPASDLSVQAACVVSVHAMNMSVKCAC